jgi:aminoglycoside phosphotransferase family enzyme
MASRAPTVSAALEAWTKPGSLSAEVHETHTGVVVLLGDKAYKAKKELVCGPG